MPLGGAVRALCSTWVAWLSELGPALLSPVCCVQLRGGTYSLPCQNSRFNGRSTNLAPPSWALEVYCTLPRCGVELARDGMVSPKAAAACSDELGCSGGWAALSLAGITEPWCVFCQRFRVHLRVEAVAMIGMLTAITAKEVALPIAG